jgi:hypothetical protein
MIPHERSLVERLKDEPFALIGVNSDGDLAVAKPKIAEQKVTWRSFWNGEEGTEGPISTEWGVKGWPTLYLIDAEGKIRRRFAGSPGDAVLDAEIDKLVAETKAKAAKK